MLLLALPHALTVPSDERHEYQSQVAKMVGTVLNDYVNFFEQQVAESKGNVDASAQKANESMKEVEESAVKINDQEEEVTKRKDALQQDLEVAKAAQVASESASKEVAEFDENLQMTMTEKEHCNSIYNEHFTPLKSGVDDAKEMARLLKEVQPVLKRLCTESSLLSALAPALKKSPDARGPFDLMAIEGAEGIFTKYLEELQEKVDKADVTKAEKVSIEASSQEALKAATQNSTTSQEALKAAEEELACLEAKHANLLAACNTAA